MDSRLESRAQLRVHVSHCHPKEEQAASCLGVGFALGSYFSYLEAAGDGCPTKMLDNTLQMSWSFAGGSGLAAAMHASSCPQLCPAYSPVVTHFPAPKGLVSKDSGFQLEAVCMTRLKSRLRLGERASMSQATESTTPPLQCPHKYFPFLIS